MHARHGECTPMSNEEISPRLIELGWNVARARQAATALAMTATTVIGDLNARRLERYATLAWESGAVPVVLLTKCDLAAPQDVALARTVVGAAAPGVHVIAISAQSGEGLDELQHMLSP